MKIILNKNWLFHYVNGSCTIGGENTIGGAGVLTGEGTITGIGNTAEAYNRGFEDESWEKVVVPHDWAVTMPFKREYSSGTGYLAGGIGWYRFHFTLPKEAKGKMVRVVFDGVYKHSQVWCNSYYMGRWANGYTSFSYDLTSQVSFGEEENVIAVKVSHPDIADSRWYTGSGITRKVYLLITDPIHIPQGGVYVTTERADRENAVVTIQTTVKNSRAFEKDTTDASQFVTVKNILMNSEGTVVCSSTSEAVINKGESKVFESQCDVTKPFLWSPNTPYLYILKTIVYESGKETDSMEQKIGIRSIRFDADQGFFINEASTKLKGVCLHEDAGCLGNAVPKKVWKRRLDSLKEMGCNAIRMSHNPHMEELYELCDEMGFFVIDEIFDEWEGPKNKWSTGHNVYPPKLQGYFEDFHEWYQKDVEAFMQKTRNHPCVILWSIGNEIDYPNDPYCHPLFNTMTGNNDANKPAAERMYNPNRPNAERLSVIAKLLADEVRRHDTSRPVTVAAAFPELSSRIGFFDAIDVIGYNYKEQFYDEDHKRFPDKPFTGSENGHIYEQWKAVTDRDFICGQFLWTGIDYLGEAHGWPYHGSGAGTMTVAGYKKGEYFFRKSLWTNEPMAYIVTERASETEQIPKDHRRWNFFYREQWNYFPGELIDVRVFTNQDSAELFINDASAGKEKKDPVTGFISFQVPFTEGTLKAVVAGNASCSLCTTSVACGMKTKVYDSSFTADGVDVQQIEVQLIDKDGLEVRQDSPAIRVEVTGEAVLLGIENGNLADNTDYSASYKNVYQGKLLIFVRSTEVAGDSTVILKGDGLQTKTISLKSL